MARLFLFAVAICTFVPATAFPQGTPADYERAAKLEALTRDKVFRTNIVPHWNERGDSFWYRVDMAKGEYEFVRVDARKGTREAALPLAPADATGLFRGVSRWRRAFPRPTSTTP